MRELGYRPVQHQQSALEWCQGAQINAAEFTWLAGLGQHYMPERIEPFSLLYRLCHHTYLLRRS
jgi:hypothetical protein